MLLTNQQHSSLFKAVLSNNATQYIEFKHLLTWDIRYTLHQSSGKQPGSIPTGSMTRFLRCLFSHHLVVSSCTWEDQLTLCESKKYFLLTSDIVSDITNKFIWSGGEPPFFGARRQSAERTRRVCSTYHILFVEITKM